MMTKLRDLWIYIRVFVLITKYAFYLSYINYFVKNPENRLFQGVHQWGLEMLAIFKTDYQLLGQENLDFSSNRPYILMSNHASFIDVPMIHASLSNEKISMIAKKELFKIPFLSLAMRMARCIKIDRENAKQAIEDLKKAKQQMMDGIRVWVAPEGTRTKNGELGVFKKGGFRLAKEMDALIVPITIEGSGDIWPVGNKSLGIGKKMVVTFHPIIDSNDYSLVDLMKKVREEIMVV